MSPFTTFVSRKVAATIAVFAAGAVVLVGVAVAQAGAGPDTAAPSSQAVDPAALEAALADPGSADSVATDATGGRSQLRADLKAAFALTGDARRDALAKIRQEAQDGAYGDRIEHRADRRQIRHDLFFSLLPDDLQTDLTNLKDAPADQREQLRADIMAKAVAGGYGPDVQKAAEQLQALHKG